MIRADLVGWSLLLIALATGYFVFIKASKVENKNLKVIGYIIGVIVIVGCLILALSDLGTRARLRKGAVAGPRRTAGMTTTRPLAAPKANVPVPRVPKTAVETAPTIPNLPTSPTQPPVR